MIRSAIIVAEPNLIVTAADLDACIMVVWTKIGDVHVSALKHCV